MNALVIGVLMVVAFFALSAAFITAAPYLAIGIIIVVVVLILSKVNTKPPQ